MKNLFVLPPQKQQEEFSIAYLHAIVSAAGYGLEHIRIDYDSIDAQIRQYGVTDDFPKIEAISVQLKCTYHHAPKGASLKYPLKRKNYNDLRRDCMNPRILVVLHVPDSFDKWLVQNSGNIVLHNEAYWISLRGMEEREDVENVTIDIPTSQVFSVASLHTLMEKVAQGVKP